jgi:hypothetical protein
LTSLCPVLCARGSHDAGVGGGGAAAEGEGPIELGNGYFFDQLDFSLEQEEDPWEGGILNQPFLHWFNDEQRIGGWVGGAVDALGGLSKGKNGA